MFVLSYWVDFSKYIISLYRLELYGRKNDLFIMFIYLNLINYLFYVKTK